MQRVKRTELIVILIVLPFWSSSVFGQASQSTGVGTKDRSFGGTAIAAPIDPIGAIHRNPGSILGFERSEMAGSLSVFFPDSTLFSSLPTGQAGEVRNQVDGIPFPSTGIVIRDDCWDVALGDEIGLVELAG